MSAPIECPICMESIQSVTVNCVTTECGHCFHTNCLMKSVVHNGFGCPYCRTKMAEEPEEEETLYDDENDDFVDDFDDDESEMFDEDALRGFRFFFNNLNGEVFDSDDEWDEDEYLEELEEERNLEIQRSSRSSLFVERRTNETARENGVLPSIEYMEAKLRENYDYKELLTCILGCFARCVFQNSGNVELNAFTSQFSEYDDSQEDNCLILKVYKDLIEVVKNYKPEEQNSSQEANKKEDINVDAQPKNSNARLDVDCC